MNNQRVLARSRFNVWLLPPGLFTLLLFAVALLAPGSQFAAEPVAEKVFLFSSSGLEQARQTSLDGEPLESGKLPDQMKLLLLDGITLTEFISREATLPRLPEFESGFSIECSARFDSQCKLFALQQ